VALCLKGAALKPIKPGCFVSDCLDNFKCVRRRYFYPGLFRLRDHAEPNVHAGCSCNEVVGLRNRLAQAVPCVQPEGLADFRKEMRILGRVLTARGGSELGVDEYQSIVNRYSGAKKKKYQSALDELNRDGFVRSRRTARTEAFVKTDSFYWDSKVNDPRIINIRNPVFTLFIAKWLLPISRLIYALTDMPHQRVGAGRSILSGLNPRQKAANLMECWNAFSDPVCIGIDASRFDAHCHGELQEIVHREYLRWFPDKEFAWCLKETKSSRGRTRNGVRYSLTGVMASGDIGTVPMTNFIMQCCLRATLRKAGVRRFCLRTEGDDAVIFVNRSDLARVTKTIGPTSLSMGLELRTDYVAFDYHEIIFNRMRLLKVSDHYELVKDPARFSELLLGSHKHWYSVKGGLKVASMTVHAYALLYGHLPVLGTMIKYVDMILDGKIVDTKAWNLDNAHMDQYLKSQFGRDWKSLERKYPRPTDEIREEFKLAFGLEIEQQRLLERRIMLSDSRFAFQFREVIDSHVYQPSRHTMFCGGENRWEAAVL